MTARPASAPKKARAPRTPSGRRRNTSVVARETLQARTHAEMQRGLVKRAQAAREAAFWQAWEEDFLRDVPCG